MGWYLPMAIGSAGAKKAVGTTKIPTSPEISLMAKEKKLKEKEFKKKTIKKSSIEKKSLISGTNLLQEKTDLNTKMGGTT